ncbi:hypothetical protein SEUCBS139899_005080 [Sporothrix eucalyptigena]|uniref:Lpxtg-domain-containing protein n=1 Tax=Sporothrix eucalyptigena TaxID=1812306 RepID=A0ABP0D5J7_9PEZI
MWPKLALVTAVALAGPATALLVASGSPCEQYCGNVLSTTTGADMTCQDSDYSSSAAGIVFESCINCELKSAYSTGNTSDLMYLLYNLRFTMAYCLFGLENNTNVAGSPCIINPACGELEDAFNYDNLTVDVGSYDYCQDWVEVQVPKCTACLGSGQTNSFMENYVTILDAACRQMPDAGSTLSVQGTPFSTIPMNVTTPSATPLYTYTPTYEAISLGGKVGIAVGGLVLILSVAGFLIVCFGRRRRRAFLKNAEARYAAGNYGGGVVGGSRDGWPSPSMIQTASKGHEKYSTPTSTQPLRGWDDTSPVSVSTMAEKNNGYFPRYFSPYSSQYNSPVSAEDGPPYTTWPTMASMTDTLAGGSSSSAAGGRHYQIGLRSVSPVADDAHDGSPGSSSGAYDQKHWPSAGYNQEEIERIAHEYELAQIGVALGGADPSLRSKNSNLSMEGSSSSAVAPGVKDFPMPPHQLHSQAQASFQQASVHGESSSSSLSSLSVSPGVLWEPSSSSRRSKRSKKSASEPSDSEDIILSTIRRPSAYERAQAQAQTLAQAEAQVQAPPSTLQQSPRPMQYYPRPPSPEMESPYGGLTEADARHGHTM